MIQRSWTILIPFFITPFLLPASANAQTPELELPTVELERVGGIVVGASAGVVLGRNEAFDLTEPGPGSRG